MRSALKNLNGRRKNEEFAYFRWEDEIEVFHLYGSVGAEYLCEVLDLSAAKRMAVDIPHNSFFNWLLLIAKE